MKQNIYNIMVILFFVLTNTLYSQSNETTLGNGVFVNPVITKYGIVATDELETSLYLISDGQIKKLISAPGCGRYFTISADEEMIGFKLINHNTELQSPSIIYLKDGSIKSFYKPSKVAGQISFSNFGKIAFTINNNLIVKGDENTTINLELFSNRTPISPSGSLIVFKDYEEQLWILNLRTKAKTKITDNKNAYCLAQWSPDERFISFSSIDAQLFLYNIKENKIIFIDKGENIKWNKNGKSLVYHKRIFDTENMGLIDSDIYKYNIIGKTSINITNTLDNIEMYPNFIDENNIIFINLNKSAIVKTSMNNENFYSYKNLFTNENKLTPVTFYDEEKNLSKLNADDFKRWIHIHQVFDTRDSGPWTNSPGGKHQGYKCCGATSAMQIIASYKILKEQPIKTHGHISNYGKYISDDFTFNDYSFNGFKPKETIGFKTGIHGYMWHYGSPSSRAVSLFSKFNISASRSDYPSWSKISKELEKGYPYMLCSIALTSGHIVVAIGKHGYAHTLVCNDPYGDKNAGSYGRKFNGKNALYDWADANTGHVQISPVVWGITARYNSYLRLLKSNPVNNEKDFTSKKNIVLNFDTPVTPESIKENITLNESNNNIEYNVEPNYSSEQIIIIPKTDFGNNKDYKLNISKGLSDIYSRAFQADTTINFHVRSVKNVSGLFVSNFEDTTNFEFASFLVNQTSKSFTISDEKKIDGKYSGKFEYTFSSSGNGYCRLISKSEPNLGGSADSSFGIWIWGDAQNHSYQLWFKKENGNLTNALSGSIDWSGWDFKYVNLSKIDKGKSVRFNSFAIRQNSSSKKYGITYFDKAIKFKTNDLLSIKDYYKNFLPGNFYLQQNYPNPFNPLTKIEFNIPETGHISLKVFNVLGEVVETLIDETKSFGKHSINFDAKNLPSGIYIYTLKFNGTVKSKKMILLK